MNKHMSNGDVSLYHALHWIIGAIKPKKDDRHLSWLHLRVRDFDPIVYARYNCQCSSNGFDELADGSWTLAFSNDEVCDADLSSMESILAPLPQNNCPRTR